MQPYILVLYYSQSGHTRDMAYFIAEGITRQGYLAKIRTVPEVYPEIAVAKPAIPAEGDIYCTIEDLAQCSGLALGSPTRFGNMAASLKYFWDQTTALWLSGALHDKPACVFTSSGSMHGGQESTLLSMYLPLLHHGMVIIGLSNSQPELSHTQSGGTPYGASHVSGARHDRPMTDHEKQLCLAQGKRLADWVSKAKHVKS